MEFGMLHEFPAVRGHDEGVAFAQALEQVDAAERFGLDAMWRAELHGAPQRSVISVPHRPGFFAQPLRYSTLRRTVGRKSKAHSATLVT
jgi:hypothetical protein